RSPDSNPRSEVTVVHDLADVDVNAFTGVSREGPDIQIAWRDLTEMHCPVYHRTTLIARGNCDRTRRMRHGELIRSPTGVAGVVAADENQVITRNVRDDL